MGACLAKNAAIATTGRTRRSQVTVPVLRAVEFRTLQFRASDVVADTVAAAVNERSSRGQSGVNECTQIS